MTRIRSVKPELFTHEALFDAEINYKLPLRLAFIGLFTCCDRQGRFRWQPRRLKLDMLPYDDVDISQVLGVLLTRGFIKKYEYQGEMYGCIPSWSRHQYINNREKDSILPSLEKSIEFESEKTNINNEMTVNTSLVCITRESPVSQALRVCPGGREQEEKGKELEGNRSIVTSKTRPSGVQSIENIFEHWKRVMNHTNAKLDDKRKAMIAKALKFGYSVEQLCDAITGCSYTPHNTGDNDRGQRYDGLHVILRDGDQIDRFIRNYQHPPQPITEADRRSKANVQTLQSWMNRTIAEERNYGNS